MLNRLSAAIAGVSIVASTTQVIAQPVDAPKTEIKNPKVVKQIQAVIEPPRTTPTKDDVAKAQIEQRLKEIAVQRQQEEERKKQEEAKAQEAAKAAQAEAVKAATKTSYNVEQWRPIIAKYPWPVEEAMLTMSRESGGNPNAVSATDDHGLFQIHNGLSNYGPAIYDPETNVRIAYGMYASRGWRPWYAVRGILW